VGQLGSRHLQGLISCVYPVDIHLQDDCIDSLETAVMRWSDVVPSQSDHRVFWHISLKDVPKKIDVAIIATPSDVRPIVVLNIARHCRVKYWILEKVLARSNEALAQICSAIGDSRRAWVNTPRRSLPWHNEIKAKFIHGCPLHLQVAGGDWGLACNSIHFLDMFAWWTGENFLSLSTDGLASEWFPAKRPGNMEVYGRIVAYFSGGSTAEMISGPGPIRYNFIVNDGPYVWTIDEEGGKASRSDGLSLTGRIPYQSEMTGQVVQTLLETGACLLPDLEQSSRMHSIFLNALLAHWQAHVDINATEIPIT
jgi:hypothetical protein